MKQLSRIIGTKKVNFVVDADIKGFYENVDHGWMMKLIRHRIADPNIGRLVVRFLKAGVIEEGQYLDTEEGTPQGGIVSPVLSNIYLHYILDLWFERVVKKRCCGEAYLVRYGDDFIACFQYESDARWFVRELPVRLGKFGLEIELSKSKIIRFGRFARRDCQIDGVKAPESFDFLGFMHYCGRSRKERFKLKWRTSRNKFHAKLQAFRAWIRRERNRPIHEIMKVVRAKLIGHYLYYGVSDNWPMLEVYRRAVVRILFKWLNRRS